jgi:hypothetical protein
MSLGMLKCYNEDKMIGPHSVIILYTADPDANPKILTSHAPDGLEKHKGVSDNDVSHPQ